MDAESPEAVREEIALAPGVDLDLWFAEDLGNASFLLNVDGADVSVVIDPWRDVDTYLPRLDRRGERQILALETHLHNDFVSGARELQSARGATIGASADAVLGYPYRPLVDQDEIPLAEYRLVVWATPGHTPEHLSYLLVDGDRRPLALFSGGALMAGSAARTDLLGPVLARPLAIRLHRTLHGRIAQLPDSTRVFPTHGGGTFCGQGDPARRTTSIGEERLSNPLLRAPSLDAFLERILEQRPYPRYFDRMRSVNRNGAPIVGFGPARVAELDLSAFDAARAAGDLVLDLRPFAEFDAGHIPESYSLGLEGAFSAWAGWLLPPEEPLLFVADDDGAPQRAARQLVRIGYERFAGALRGGFRVWRAAGRPVRSIPRVSSRQLAENLRSESPLVGLDVRERHEYGAGHLPGALNIPLGELPGRIGDVPRDAPILVHCAHGYRSAIALSILERHGFSGLVHADEGYDGWMGGGRES